MQVSFQNLSEEVDRIDPVQAAEIENRESSHSDDLRQSLVERIEKVLASFPPRPTPNSSHSRCEPWILPSRRIATSTGPPENLTSATLFQSPNWSAGSFPTVPLWPLRSCMTSWRTPRRDRKTSVVSSARRSRSLSTG